MIARALLVGVADYVSISGLPPAVEHDVADIANVLRDQDVIGLPIDAVTLLLNEQATTAAIRTAFADIAADMPANGTFLFYFSGHGERAVLGGREQSWLLPHDAKLGRLAATALASDELAGLLDAIPAKRQVLLIDACHAGGIGSTKAPGAPEPKGFGKSGVDALSQGAGRALLTSSRADERSGILIGERNSVFTAALLEALDGATIDRGDGLIGVLDVFEYVSAAVPKRVDQHPIFHAGDLDSNFALARRKPQARAAVPDVGTLTALFVSLYPTGPLHDNVWARAGGDLSRLALAGSGVAQWHSALAKVLLGGGGLTLNDLVRAALTDYPGQPELIALVHRAGAGTA